MIININCQPLVCSERGCRSSVECIPSPLRYSHPVHFYSTFSREAGLSDIFFVTFPVTNHSLQSTGQKITSDISAQCRGLQANFGYLSAPRLYMTPLVEEILPATGMEDKKYEK